MVRGLVIYLAVIIFWCILTVLSLSGLRLVLLHVEHGVRLINGTYLIPFKILGLQTMELPPLLLFNEVGVTADLVDQYTCESGCLPFSIRLIVLFARDSLLALAVSVVLRHYKN